MFSVVLWFWLSLPWACSESARPAISSHFELDKIVLRQPSNDIPYAYYSFVPASVQKASPTRVILLTDGGPPYKEYKELVGAFRESRLIPFSRLASKHGYVFVMPILPRDYSQEPDQRMNSQVLNRRSMFSKAGFYGRPDVTLLKILKEVFTTLESHHIKPAKKIFMTGFSSGGNAANRFSILYPDKVAAVAIGAAGLFMYPIPSWNGAPLSYPIGTSDIGKISGARPSLSEFKSIPHYVFVGEKDDDPNHDPVPRDGGSNDMLDAGQAEFVLKNFGENNVKRTKAFCDYLSSIGVQPRSTVFPGVGHEFTDEMKESIFDFFDSLPEEALR